MQRQSTSRQPDNCCALVLISGVSGAMNSLIEHAFYLSLIVCRDAPSIFQCQISIQVYTHSYSQAVTDLNSNYSLILNFCCFNKVFALIEISSFKIWLQYITVEIQEPPFSRIAGPLEEKAHEQPFFPCKMLLDCSYLRIDQKIPSQISKVLFVGWKSSKYMKKWVFEWDYYTFM